MPSRDELKRLAAVKAVELISSGMVVGLGAGSTAIYAIRHLGALIADGTLTGIVGVPCSVLVEEEARKVGIPIVTLETHPVIDLTIDGADEVDPDLNLIKGGGGALLREKIVAQASKREVIVVDEEKRSAKLGIKWAVPIEVLPFGHGSQKRFLETLGGRVTIRQTPSGETYHTDQGNLIFDTAFGPIDDVPGLAAKLMDRAGIVEHGLFVGIADDLIVAGANGVEHVRRPG